MQKNSKFWLICIVSVVLAVNLFYVKPAESKLMVNTGKKESNPVTSSRNNYLRLPFDENDLPLQTQTSRTNQVNFLPTLTSSGHPRLFFESNDIPMLQAQANSTHQEIWLPIKDYVDSQLGTAPPALSSPDDSLEVYRNYGSMLIPFAFACVITEDPNYCDLAKTYLLTYATWENWGENDHRDLGLAHMLLGNALAYDWLYNNLTPAEQQTVGHNLANWAQKMYRASSAPREVGWGNWWRKSYLQNHYWTNNSALGVAGLALLGEDDRAQMWVDQAKSRLTLVRDILNGIEDGSWHESINYQSYGLTLMLPFMLNLRKIQSVDILPDKYLRNYPYWRIYNHLPNSTQVILAYGNFEWEWGNSYRPQNVLRFVASEYDLGHAEWMAQQLIAADGRNTNVWSTPWYVFEFLYYDPTIKAQLPTDLEKARTFPDLEGVIWRTGWEDDDLIFGLKTGAYGGRFAFDTFTQEVYPWETPCLDTGCQLNIGHNHNDTNGFYLYRAGHWLVPESEGFDQSPTSFHNSILIDGEGQYRPPSEGWRDPTAFMDSDGFLEATANTQNFDYVAADATHRYKQINGIEDITRYVLFRRPNYFLVVDNVAADAAHNYDWVAHFDENLSIQSDWIRGEAGDGQLLGVGVASPESFQTTTGDDGQPFVYIRPTSPVDDLRFINLLYPTDETLWDTRPDITVLDDTGEAVAVQIHMNDNSDQTDDILITYSQSISNTTDLSYQVGPYEYDGQVAVVSRGTNGSLEKLFLYGGTYLTDQTTSQVLVSNLNRNNPFEVVYSDLTVAISGHISAEVVLYAPEAKQLLINGEVGSFSRSGDDYIIIGGLNRVYLPIIMKRGQ